MKEGLPPEHGRELLRDPLEQLLDGRGVANEGGGHLQTSGRDVTHRSFHIVWDPLNKVGAVLALDFEKLLLDFLHGYFAAEDTSHRDVPPMTRVAVRHHVPWRPASAGSAREPQGLWEIGDSVMQYLSLGFRWEGTRHSRPILLCKSHCY